MCLYYNYKATLNLRRNMKENGGKITVYKIYNVDYKKKGMNVDIMPSPPFRDGSVVIDNLGFVESNRPELKKTPEEKKFRKISLGIHVYLSLPYAENEKTSRQIILQGTGYLSDLVGSNSNMNHAVFMRVQFDKKDLREKLSGLDVKEAILDRIMTSDQPQEDFQSARDLYYANKELSYAKDRIGDAKSQIKAAKQKLAYGKRLLKASIAGMKKQEKEISKAKAALAVADKKEKHRIANLKKLKFRPCI